MAPAESRNFYPALDGLRAIALLMVFFQHYISLPWGWTGVQIFFVLSGFLITGILLDTLGPGAAPRPHPMRDFYLRRTLRIFPLYYAIFLGLLLLAPFLHWNWTAWWLAWPLYLGNFLRFVNPSATVMGTPLINAANAWLFAPTSTVSLNFGHFWSLCVEEQFYLIWPWVIAGAAALRARGRSFLLWLCIIAVVVSPWLRILTSHVAPAWMLQNEILYRLLPFQLDSLLLGGLIALLWRIMDRNQLLQYARVIAALTGTAVIVYLALTLHLSNPNWCAEYAYPTWLFTWAPTFVNVTAASIILCCLRTSGRIARALSFAPLRWIGRISYGAYVFHDILHNFYARLVYHDLYHFARTMPFVMDHFWPHRNLIVAAVALPFTLLLAAISYRFFELPFLRLKDRLAPKSAAAA